MAQGASKKELAENGDNRNIKIIAASMKRQDLTPKAARKFKCTTDSKHKPAVAPNKKLGGRHHLCGDK